MISIKLPEKVMFLYVVPSDKPPTDLRLAIADAVKRLVGNQIRDITLQLLSTEAIQVEVCDKDQFLPIPLEMLAQLGARPEQLAIMKKAKQLIVIRTRDNPVWPPYHEFAVRAAACALALELNSTIVDLFLPAIISPAEALSKLPDEHKPILFADWLRVLQSSSSNGLWMTTKGLERLGLPELQTVGIPPQLERVWALAMTGIAWKIVNRLGTQALTDKATHFDLPQEMELSESDVADAYHSKITHGGSAKVYLRLDAPNDENESEFLTIVAPPSDARPFGEFLVDTAIEIFGAQNDRVVAAPSDAQAMDEAIAQARAELTEVRNRFLANKFPRGGQLILKFRIKDGTNSEYLWAFPLNWKWPNEIEATCGNDSQFDTSFRAGRRVKLKLDSIVDWAVLVNEQIVEGARTNKVLGH